MLSIIEDIKLEGSIEFSNDYSFFTYEETALRCNVLSKISYKSKNKITKYIRLKFPFNKYLLKHVLCKCDKNNYQTKITLKCNRRFKLNDFVARYKIPFEIIKYVKINSLVISEFQENKYYQFETTTVNVVFKDNKSIYFRNDKKLTKIPKATKLCIYAKKSGADLIIHMRILPTENQYPVIKLCNRHFLTLPLPQIITKFVQICMPSLFSSILYHSEVKPTISLLNKLINPVAFYNFQVDELITIGVNITHLD